jgi:hypothetical protein
MTRLMRINKARAVHILLFALFIPRVHHALNHTFRPVLRFDCTSQIFHVTVTAWLFDRSSFKPFPKMRPMIPCWKRAFISSTSKPENQQKDKIDNEKHLITKRIRSDSERSGCCFSLMYGFSPPHHSLGAMINVLELVIRGDKRCYFHC